MPGIDHTAFMHYANAAKAGSPVSRAFVQAQQAQLAAVADLVAELHAAGVPEDHPREAGAGRWALPPEGLGPAIREAYATLGPPSLAGRSRQPAVEP